MVSTTAAQGLKSRLTGVKPFFCAGAFLVAKLARNLVAERVGVGLGTGESRIFRKTELLLTWTYI